MIAYFDCFSGVAGDMVLGAMLDAGLPFAHLKLELGKLPVKGYRLEKKTERRGVVGGVNLRVIARNDMRDSLTYKEIKNLIRTSRLNKDTSKIALAIFETLARAEAHVHRTKIDHVHFHEVGAVDSIVDIIGAAIGFNYFKFDGIYSSPLPVLYPPLKKGDKGGFIKCTHGNMPIPAPATLEILKDVSIIASPVKAEIVTPTGAAILKTVVKDFGESPLTKIKTIGYGLGDDHFKQIPNALRLIIGDGERLVVVEANIDDMNPQFYDHIITKLINAGALDATVRPLFMKKRRPGALLQAICGERLKSHIAKIILKETTSFGVRFYPVERRILERTIKPVKTKFGTIRMKLGFMDGGGIKAVPEYEDCARIARRLEIPLVKVYESAVKN